MYRAYLDESEEGAIFAVGGFVGTDDQWNCLEGPWCAALPKGITYFHATDCFGGRGKFRDVPIAVRSALLDQLIQLIIDANIRLICGAIQPVAGIATQASSMACFSRSHILISQERVP